MSQNTVKDDGFEVKTGKIMEKKRVKISLKTRI